VQQQLLQVLCDLGRNVGSLLDSGRLGSDLPLK